MNEENTLHARPPILPPEIYQAVAQGAEANPESDAGRYLGVVIPLRT